MDLSAFAGSPAVQVRFTFESDHDLVFEGWYVDNIRVEQTFLDCAIEPMTRPGCGTDADCDDGAPCTTGRCSSGQCVHVAIGGFVGAECKLGEALSRSLCGPERIDQGLQSFVTKKLTRARDLLQKAERNAKAPQSSRLIGRADRSLLAISRRASRAATTRRISATCRVLIGQRIRELRQAVAGLRR